jgi:hypothetical protein
MWRQLILTSQGCFFFFYFFVAADLVSPKQWALVALAHFKARKI